MIVEYTEIMKQEIKELVKFNLLHEGVQLELARITLIQSRMYN